MDEPRTTDLHAELARSHAEVAEVRGQLRQAIDALKARDKEAEAMENMLAQHQDLLRQAADVLEKRVLRRTPRTLRSAHEGAEERVRQAFARLSEVDEVSQADKAGAAALLSEALLLLSEAPPRFDFGQALFARLIKSYEGTMVRPGVYRLDLSLGNLRSAISIVEGDERAVWTQTAARERP